MPIPTNQILVAELVVKGTQAPGGSAVTPSINVFYYKRTNTANVPDKTLLYNQFNTVVIAPLLLAANVRYTVNRVGVRWADDALDLPIDVVNAGVGAIATDSLPSDDAVYFRLYTALRGKSYRGGKHFSPASEIDTTNDLLTGAGLARWQVLKTAMAANLTDANGNVWNPVVLSRKLSQLKKNPTTLISNAITSVVLDANIGTMRRRRSKTVTA
jgi:hypothetical protein